MVQQRRLEAARRLDWRFLLPHAGIGEVAVVEPADDGLTSALRELAPGVESGPAAALAASGRTFDLVVVSGAGPVPDRSTAATLLGLVEPELGALVVELRHRTGRRRLEAALRASGAATQAIWQLPRREAATRLVPLDDPVAVRAGLRRHASSRRGRLRGTAARVAASVLPPALLGGDVVLVARPAARRHDNALPILPALSPPLDRAAQGGPASWVLLTPRFRASAHVVMLVAGPDARPRLVVKAARLRDENARVEQEAARLRDLAGSVRPGSVPEVLTVAAFDGHAVLVETALDGEPLDRTRLRRDPARWIDEVARWIAGLPAGAAPGSETIGSVEERLRRLSDETPGASAGSLVGATTAALATLRSSALPPVFEHGDLGHPNLVVLADGGIGVLDWETARRDGLPLHDLVFFLGYVALATARPGEEAWTGFERVLAHGEWGAVAALRAEAARRGVAPDAIPALVLTAWARATCDLLDRTGFGPASSEAASWLAASRYTALWEGTALHLDRIAALLA